VAHTLVYAAPRLVTNSVKRATPAIETCSEQVHKYFGHTGGGHVAVKAIKVVREPLHSTKFALASASAIVKPDTFVTNAKLV
jgi:hypothetical protein